MRLCKSCGEKKPPTKEFWVLVSSESKRGKQYPHYVGNPVGRCKVCRNKAQLKYQKTFHGKKKIKEAYRSRGKDYKILLNVQSKKRDKIKKETLIYYMGGKCEVCGYNRCIGALDFHHINPHDKKFGINEQKSKPIEELFDEADKCRLLCANCHREHHYNENSELLKDQEEYLQTTKYKNHEYIRD